MVKQAKRAKPEQLALPGFDPVEPKSGAVGGCIDLNTRQYASEYRTWSAMVYRCERPDFSAFARYGGKGVKVCPEWRRSFAAFVRDMGRRPEGMTLDRIDPAGDYEPANCRWLDAAENSRRGANKKIAGFSSRTLAAVVLGGHPALVATRLRDGWCEYHAATLPKGSKRPAECALCAASRNGGRVFVRRRRGWCEEHAATLPKGSKRPADCAVCNAKGGA